MKLFRIIKSIFYHRHFIIISFKRDGYKPFIDYTDDSEIWVEWIGLDKEKVYKVIIALSNDINALEAKKELNER